MSDVPAHRRWVITRLIPAMSDRDTAVQDLQRGYPLIESYLAEGLSLGALDAALEWYTATAPRPERTVRGVLKAWVAFESNLEDEVTADPDDLNQTTVKWLRNQMGPLMTLSMVGIPTTKRGQWAYPRWMIDIALEVAMEFRADGSIRHIWYHDEARHRFDNAISERFQLAS